MKKFSVIIAAVTILIVILGIFLAARSSSSAYPLPTNLAYYWGDGCLHCANVEEFLKTWDKKDKVVIDKKEVWGNAANAKELKARYESCKITDPNEMGVPLLFTPEGKCYSGDQPIIDYLKNLK